MIDPSGEMGWDYRRKRSGATIAARIPNRSLRTLINATLSGRCEWPRLDRAFPGMILALGVFRAQFEIAI